jgi:hypothetical protein
MHNWEARATVTALCLNELTFLPSVSNCIRTRHPSGHRDLQRAKYHLHAQGVPTLIHAELFPTQKAA